MTTVSGITTVTSTPVQFIGPVVQVGGTDGKVGFFGATPVAQPTGVAVTAAEIHAALVALGLITA